jgi:hypothetical protein
MKRNWLIVKILLVGTIALLLAWSITLVLGTEFTQANPELPPLIAHVPTDITINTVPTPTLPSRLKPFAPAFQIEAVSYPVTMTIDTTGLVVDTSRLHLVYQANPQDRWQLVYADHNAHTLQPIRLPGTGTYAWVWLAPAAVPPAPTGALVVDDVAPEFVTYTHSTPQYWHIATTGGDYYGGHTHWTRNTQTTSENWATWQPTTPLTGPYAVWVYVPNDYANTEHARYTVGHAGMSTTVTINQNAIYPDAAWVQLGIFNFISTTASYVHLTDMTGEPYDSYWIAFDAVAFVPQAIYLPLALRNWPPSPPIKQWSGMHLGNRIRNDWDENRAGESVDFLDLIDGSSEAQSFPAAIVVLSNQVYELETSSVAPCDITGVHVREGREHVYQYLRKAAQAGVKVIIRLYPSPGNFQDWDEDPGIDGSGWKDHLLLTEADQTARGTYCMDGWSDPIPGDPKWVPRDHYRAIDDLAREMHYIHQFNTADNWTEFGFLPANEINLEWYMRRSEPPISNYAAWQAMNAYFVNLYDYVQMNYPGELRVFAPPMSQSLLAEAYNMDGCVPMSILGPEGESLTGYDWMRDTYETHNDGIAWNNYFLQGGEEYVRCRSGEAHGWHISYYFPSWMHDLLVSGDKIGIISETDLCSWFADNTGQCSNNNTLQDKDTNVTATALSLRTFFANEELYGDRVADYVVSWLINSDVAENPDTTEQDWHEAYRDDGTLRMWFSEWWSGTE